LRESARKRKRHHRSDRAPGAGGFIRDSSSSSTGAAPRATHSPAPSTTIALTPKKTPSAVLAICGEQVGDNRGCDAVTGSTPGTVHRAQRLTGAQHHGADAQMS